MSRIIFSVSYKIPEQRRQEYLELIGQLKQQYQKENVSMIIMEYKNQRNHFQELTIFPTEEDYDRSDEKAERTAVGQLVDKIYEFASDQSYTVATELL